MDIFIISAQSIGGQISQDKTKWYLLEFIWDSAGKWRLADNGAHISLTTQYKTQDTKRLPHYINLRIL